MASKKQVVKASIAHNNTHSKNRHAIAVETTIGSLTPRELQVLQLAANGLTTIEIAETIFLSKDTVESHRKKVIMKMKVRNMIHAVAEALRKKWIH